MALDPSNSTSLEQLALKGLTDWSKAYLARFKSVALVLLAIAFFLQPCMGAVVISAG